MELPDGPYVPGNNPSKNEEGPGIEIIDEKQNNDGSVTLTLEIDADLIEPLVGYAINDILREKINELEQEANKGDSKES